MSTATDSLTGRQNDILAFIVEHQREKGYPPTHREIMAKFEIKSPNGVRCHLAALRKKGAITCNAMLSRGIQVVGSGPAPPPATGSMILAYVRGAMGAGEMVVGEVAGYLAEHWPAIPGDVQAEVRALVDEAWEADAAQSIHHPVLSATDSLRAQWDRVRALWEGRS